MINVGVLSPVTGGFFYGDVQAGIVREVAAVGGRMTLIQTLDAGMSGDELAPAADNALPIGWDHIDGFIAVSLAADAESLRRIRAAGKPVVLTSNIIDDLDAATVMADNELGVREAVTHLILHGHTRIAFVGNLDQTDMMERHAGYEVAMAEHGLSTQGLYITTVDHVENGGAKAVDLLVARHPQITAVVTTTDRLATGLMEALTERGFRIPQDVAVVGFDNMEAGWHIKPPLATVDQQLTELGATSARLLLAELRGEPVEHNRHTVPSVLIPRASCGCSTTILLPAQEAVTDGRTLVSTIGAHLGLPLLDDGRSATHGINPGDVDVAALANVIETTLSTLFAKAPSPETLTQFTETVMELLDRGIRVLTAQNMTGGEILRHCMAQVTVILSHLQAISGTDRAQRLAASLREQYNVGMALLGRTDLDPCELAWLDTVSVGLGCIGLWDGPPEHGNLRITGVYDPAGAITDPIALSCNVTAFPPKAIIEQADPNKNEITFVVPIKGSTGNHGLLCIVGKVDTHSGTGRVTYNHWAALLGAALQQRSLLTAVGLSEERHSLAATVTRDGLWDWDVVDQRCYFSERCNQMLGVPADEATGTDVTSSPDATPAPDDMPELAPWIDRIHPEDRPHVRATLSHAVTSQESFEFEHRVATQEGQFRWMLCRGRTVGTPGRPARRIVGSLADIHERKQLEQQLRQVALYDDVTGLPNRRLFLERLAWAIEQSRGRSGTRFAVVFLGLDGFKLINDSLGHLQGDALLTIIGERLSGDLRSGDTAARFGGDEFAILLYGLKQEAVLSIVGRFQDRIAEPVTLTDHQVSVTASVGIATSDTGYTNAEDVLRDADTAMYHAKEAERGTACVFDPVMHTRATGRLTAQSELRTAMLEEQFVVHYQPIVALDGSDLCKFEALVRWQHPTRGLLLPAEFLPVMYETGMVVLLGQWIIDAVCAQIAQWRMTYDGPLTVAVNLSHREFWSDALMLTVTQALSRHDVPARCLVLEITESVIMADPEAARQIMADLHAGGVRIHVDDFGTGQSSLHALRAFPVDALKIDQSFVQQLAIDDQTTELVRIMVSMGRVLGLDVVAEGVETPTQAEYLRNMGCANVQGWLFARAVPGSEAGRLIGAPLPQHAPAHHSA